MAVIRRDFLFGVVTIPVIKDFKFVIDDKFVIDVPNVTTFRAKRVWKSDGQTLKFSEIVENEFSKGNLICLSKMILEFAKERGDLLELNDDDVKDLKVIKSFVEV